MKRIKNKGITLIALVITIIILLILAGISISMIAGENGILNKAKLAKEDYEKEAEKEKDALEEIYNRIPVASNGTITVNEDDLNNLIQTKVEAEISNIKNEMYPVGSIYISTEKSTAEDVEAALGGKWKAYGEGRTIIGAGSNKANNDTTYGELAANSADFSAGKMGGTYIHNHTGLAGATTLTVEQIPSHTHNINMWFFNNVDLTSDVPHFGVDFKYYGQLIPFSPDPLSERYGYATATGGGQAHTHTITGDSSIQPYIVTYMWQRYE